MDKKHPDYLRGRLHAALVILGNTMEVFMMGQDADGCSAATLLQAGNLRIVEAIERHGK